MKKLLLAIIILVCFSFVSYAQFGSSGIVDARSMGMAKTYNASTNGVYSLGINPANMMFNRNGSFEFSTVLPMPGLAISIGTNFMTINDVNYFFGGVDGNARLLSTEDKVRFNDLFKDGGEVFGGVSVNLFSAVYRSDASVGAFGISISDFMGGTFRLPKALVDLGLNGNQMNKTYDFNDAAMTMWWLRNYSLSYARELPEIEQSIFDKIAVGISLKMVSGFSYANLDRVNTFITTGAGNQITGKADLVAYTAFSEDFGMKYDFDPTTDDAKSNMGIFPKPAGSGFGIDFGVGALMEKWRFSLSVTDIGKITWDQKTVKYTATGDITVTDLSDSKQLDTLKQRLKGKGAYTGSFSTDLPTTLRAGASYFINDPNDDVPGNLLLALDINMGFNDLPGNSTKPRVSLGIEWIPLGWLNVRTGFSVGGYDGFNWALGLGFDAGLNEFHLATTDMQSFVSPNTAKRISVSLGSRWKI